MKEIQKEFLPYHESLELKNMGFDGECLAIYNKEQEFTLIGELRIPYPTLNNSHHIHTGNEVVCAPLYQQAFNWAKDKMKMKFYIQPDIWNEFNYIYILTGQKYEEYGSFKNEEQLELIRKIIQLSK